MQENGRSEIARRMAEMAVVEGLQKQIVANLEANPEMRHLIADLVKDRAERLRMAESFSLLPEHDVKKLFEAYIEDILEVISHRFFGRLYDGILEITRTVISERLDLIEERIQDLKSSIMMSSLHPYTWINYEIENAIRDFLAAQPGSSAGLDAICKYLVGVSGVPMPYSSQIDQYRYIQGLLRRMTDIQEMAEFLFRLSSSDDTKEVFKNGVSEGAKAELARLQSSIRSMAPPDAENARAVQEVDGRIPHPKVGNLQVGKRDLSAKRKISDSV